MQNLVKRPFLLAVSALSLFSFIMLAPVVISTLTKLSENIIFQTSEIHFHLNHITENDLKNQIRQSLDLHDLSGITTVEFIDSNNFKTVRIYFESNKNQTTQINAFVETLKANDALLFARENFKSHLKDGFLQSQFQLLSQVIILIVFSIIYLRFFSQKIIRIESDKSSIYILINATLVSLALAVLISSFFYLIDFLNIGFDEFKQLNQSNIHQDFWYYFVAIIMAPLIEELVFRGVIFKNFILNKLLLKGAVFTSILFASMHQWQIWQANLGIKITHFITMFIISMVFCWLYKTTARLWVPIYAHSLYNSILIIIEYIGN